MKRKVGKFIDKTDTNKSIITLFLDSSGTFTHTPEIGPNSLLHFSSALIQHWRQLDNVNIVKINQQQAEKVPNYIPSEHGIDHRHGVSERFQFPLKHYQAVVRSLTQFQPDWKISCIPPNTLDAIQHANGMAARTPPKEKLLEMVPSHILENLFDYQKDGVAFAVSRGGRAMLADEMGVGKSRQGLALLAVYQWEWPALLICPSSLKSQWRTLIEEWFSPLLENPQFQQRYASFLTPVSATGNNAIGAKPKKKKARTVSGPDVPHGLVREIETGTDPMDCLVNIISYDLAGTEEKAREIEGRRFQVCLLDESHYLKSRSAKRVKTLLPVLSRAKRIVLLSGTPTLNRPAELFSQMHLLRRDVFSNFHAFGERYCAAKKEKFGWNYDGHSNLQELNVVLETLCMIRRTKAEVLGDLPPKHRERVCLKLTDEQRRLVDKGVENLREVENQKNIDPVTKKAAFMTLWREIGKVKLPSVIEYVHDLLVKRGLKFVLFAHHQFVLDELDAFLTRKQVRFIRIDGKTQSKHRKALVDDFQTNDEVRVALLSITAAGVGIPLFAAHTVVFAELYWTCGSLLQAEDRCHRLGQTEPVTVHYLLAENTADEKIWFILRRKMDVVNQVLSNAAVGTAGARGAGGLEARYQSYDEELTQTVMAEFISALIKQCSSSTLTHAHGDDDKLGVSEHQMEIVAEPMLKKPKTAQKKKSDSELLANPRPFVWPPPNLISREQDVEGMTTTTTMVECKVRLPNKSEYQ